MLATEQFEEIGVWPIQLRIQDKMGHTLWTDNDDYDLLLAVSNNVLLFKNPLSLQQFVRRGNSCNMSDLPGYQQLRNMLTTVNNGHEYLPPYYLYDFMGVKALLSEQNWTEWTIEECSKILDSLNLLYDFAITSDDDLTVDMLSGEEGSEISELMNELTFIEAENLLALNKINRKQVYDMYKKILLKAEGHILFVC